MVSTCLLGLLASPAAMVGQADVVLVDATVLTADASRPRAQALALAGGRILAVGSDDDVRRLARPASRIVDLGGRTVIPGLIDAHVHLLVAPEEIVDELSR